jgi:DNA-binding HxlR family transcriptional regulator
MHHQTYDAGICVMTKIFHLIGGKWKPIILYLIQRDVSRFSLLKKSMPKVSKKVLTEQLRELEEDKLILRTVITATAPQVVVYRLTDKGVSLRNLIDNMISWGIVYFKEEYDEYPDELIAEFLNKPAINTISKSDQP